jgi:hypothetical protein
MTARTKTKDWKAYLRRHGLVDGSPPMKTILSAKSSRAARIRRTLGAYQMWFSDEGSLTIRLSRGERPVLAPEYAVRAPLEVMAVPVSYT